MRLRISPAPRVFSTGGFSLNKCRPRKPPPLHRPTPRPTPRDPRRVLAPARPAPAATALHALNLSMRAMHRPLPEASLLVIGGGAIGLLTALLARSYGCRNIVLAETNALRRASAEQHAGCKTFDPT